MRLNANFSQRASLAPHQHQWVASPQPGVQRVMLDRVGDEKARATSLVRYAPASTFPSHNHPGGEEILVLEGEFAEGDQRFPAGWYMRNPPGSSHQPASAHGALLFVKLWQMPAHNTAHVRVDTRDPAAWLTDGERAVCPLYADDAEQVALHRLRPGEALFSTALPRPPVQAELLVISGTLRVDAERLTPGSWLRLPAHDQPVLQAGDEGATVYLKTGEPSRLERELA
jgi:anti-sigma factor ChrR (cupin superfamily)